jgi:hypothetical protein
MRKSTGKATVRTSHGVLNEELLKHCRAKRESLDSISRSRAKLYEYEPPKSKHARQE